MNISRKSSNLIISFLIILPAFLSSASGYIYAKSLDANSFQATDWFISNDFGLTRRGLVGEALRIFSDQFRSFDINLFAFSFSAIAAFIVSLILAKYSRGVSATSRLALAYSPAFFPVFCLWDLQGQGRKEALALIFIVIYLLLSKIKKPLALILKNILAIIVLPLLVLVHEGIFFFCAPILIFLSAVDWLNLLPQTSASLDKYKELLHSQAKIIPSLIALIFATVYANPPISQVYEICGSWQIIYPHLDCNPLPSAFEALAGTGTTVDGYDSYLEFNKSHYFHLKIYIKWVLASAYAILIAVLCNSLVTSRKPMIANSRQKIQLAKILMFLILLQLIFTAPLYLMAIDYGRWYSTSLTLLIMVCAVYSDEISTASLFLSPQPKVFLLISSWRRLTEIVPIVLLVISGLCITPHSPVSFFRFSPIFYRFHVLIDSIQTYYF